MCLIGVPSKCPLVSLMQTILPTIVVQVQSGRGGDRPCGNWINKVATAKPLGVNVLQLSGVGMRGYLYLGTAPGSHPLAVSAITGG
jgi:hypothetical protein